MRGRGHGFPLTALPRSQPSADERVRVPSRQERGPVLLWNDPFIGHVLIVQRNYLAGCLQTLGIENRRGRAQSVIIAG
jgi:hypothetical protein